MKVRVKVSVFGNYKKGDEIEMHDSTAKACIKHGKVEDVNTKKSFKKVDADNN